MIEKLDWLKLRSNKIKISWVFYWNIVWKQSVSIMKHLRPGVLRSHKKIFCFDQPSSLLPIFQNYCKENKIQPQHCNSLSAILLSNTPWPYLTFRVGTLVQSSQVLFSYAQTALNADCRCSVLLGPTRMLYGLTANYTNVSASIVSICRWRWTQLVKTQSKINIYTRFSLAFIVCLQYHSAKQN